MVLISDCILITMLSPVFENIIIVISLLHYYHSLVLQALTVLGAQRERDIAAKREREVELSKVSIKKDDVELIVG